MVWEDNIVKREELIESFHSIHELMNRVKEILPKLSENQIEINKVLSDNLTSTNNKIIDALTADKNLEPLVAERLLEILTTNNHEIADALRSHNLLEQSRIDLLLTLSKIQKLYLKVCKGELKN